MSTYVDTSVLGAYYCREALSRSAEEVLRRVNEPVISMLTELEFVSLISKKRRQKELTERETRQTLDKFFGHVAEGYYRRLAVTAEHYLKARQLMESFRSALRTLDALHLAVAMSNELPVLTADGPLAAAAKKHRVKVTLVK